MVLVAFKFPEIHGIRNLHKRTMLIGSRWSFALNQNCERLRDVLNSEFKIEELGKPNTYWVSVWSLWRMGFHSLKHWKFDVAPTGRDRIFYMPYQFFPILFKSSSNIPDVGWKSSQLPQNYSRLCSFPTLRERGPAKNPACSKLQGTQKFSPSLTVILLSVKKQKSRSKALIFLCDSLIYWKKEFKILLEEDHRSSVPKMVYYLHYKGSIYCTEQEFRAFYMQSCWPETTR